MLGVLTGCCAQSVHCSYLLKNSYEIPRMPGYRPLMLPSQQTRSAGAVPLVLVVLAAEVLLLTLALLQRHHVVLLGVAPAPSACVIQTTVVKLLATTGQAIPPTLKVVRALLPGATELGKPLPFIVMRVPPAKLPVLGLTESTCAYTWNMRGAGLADVAVMKASLLRASPPAKRPSKLTVTLESPATPTPIWGSPCSGKWSHTVRLVEVWVRNHTPPCVAAAALPS